MIFKGDEETNSEIEVFRILVMQGWHILIMKTVNIDVVFNLRLCTINGDDFPNHIKSITYIGHIIPDSFSTSLTYGILSMISMMILNVEYMILT